MPAPMTMRPPDVGAKMRGPRSNNSTSSVGAAADADSKVSTRSHAASSSSSRSSCGSASRRRSHDNSRGTSSPAHGSESTALVRQTHAPFGTGCISVLPGGSENAQNDGASGPSTSIVGLWATRPRFSEPSKRRPGASLRGNYCCLAMPPRDKRWNLDWNDEYDGPQIGVYNERALKQLYGDLKDQESAPVENIVRMREYVFATLQIRPLELSEC